jgi:hypothetical protein
MSIYEVLSEIQKTIKVTKDQRNNFGNYNYRSCEDILAEVKTHLPNGYIIQLIDDVVLIGDRFYVKSIARFTNGSESVETQAFAREELTKKGMDSAQLTGATSSYARKYALSGLFGLDDEKDSDSTNKHDKTHEPQRVASKPVTQNNQQKNHVGGVEYPASEAQKKAVFAIAKKNNDASMTSEIISKMTSKQAGNYIERGNKK